MLNRSCRTGAGTSGGHRTSRFVLALLLSGACSGSGEPPTSPSSFTVLSESFADGEVIDERFTCDGADTPPSIGWEDESGSKSYALTITDEDADDFVHWAVLGIPGSVANFPEGNPPPTASDGLNDFGSVGYRGPCPPPDDPAHTYVITVYALDRSPDFFEGTASGHFTAEEMLDAIGCCVIARGTMEMRYDR